MKARFNKNLILLCLFFSSVLIYSQTDRDKMMKKIDGWNKKFCAAMIAGDNKTMLTFYADDAYDMPSYSPMAVGKKAIMESMMSGESSGMKMTSFNLNTKDFWMSGDLLCEVGTYDLVMTMPGQSAPTKDNGKYLTVYQKQKDGSWKIKADIWNTDLNPFAGMK